MLKNKSLVSIEDVTTTELEEIFKIAGEMENSLASGKPLKTMDGKIMVTIFYEPSTRTRLSFESAMHRLGGSVLSISEIKSSSVAKGETLADTVRMAEGYADIIVVRHPMEGAARLASRFSSKPVINAGDGSGQHPTQTILDLYTIRKEIGDLNGKEITIVGDLKYGRTVHSLLIALSKYDVSVNLVSPQLLRLPNYVYSRIENSMKVKMTEDLNRVIETTDVLYVTRIQKERFSDPNEYKSVIGSYSINMNTVSAMKEKSIIMHPLPRIDEISPEVDRSPKAVYFRQANNGVPVRMALISEILG
ncbi:MAG: aspartate carbamoyltransferase [Thermoplasmatales archaeon]|nr:aspartate carbamoyltransferase [Thermoplasmatales archaeon]MCW6170701.1 aspartate carbamoyltransferase [Thermoplasmatales archaeon]